MFNLLVSFMKKLRASEQIDSELATASLHLRNVLTHASFEHSRIGKAEAERPLLRNQDLIRHGRLSLRERVCIAL